MSAVENLFSVIDDSTILLKKELSIPYLEALISTGENLFYETIEQSIKEDSKKRLQQMYNKVDMEKYSQEDIRKAMQLAILKGMKEAIQPHHEMTPDAVSLFMTYLVVKWIKEKQSVRILDPVVGTGNLLTAILNGLPQNAEASAYGVEADETLLKLAYVNANLQRHSIELFHGDAIRPLFIDPVDVIVADLPVGYYPNDDIAKDYELHMTSGHSYIHHLLIEQSIRYAKEGAVLLFLIPNHLFDRDAEKLHTFIHEHAYIQGLLELPRTMFKKEMHAKSIFMLQKKGNGSKKPKEVLIGSLPSFSNKQALSNIIAKIDAWFQYMHYEQSGH
jgi:site-specific DNA-methyltransferase (adenine-specific)